MADQVSDVCSNALRELGVIAGGEQANGDDIEFVLSKLNRMLDQWQARNVFAFNETFTNYTLTANHSPHLIGPGLNSPDFATPAAIDGGSGTNQRPSKVAHAAIIFNNVTPNVTKPIPVHNGREGADWWANQRVKTLGSQVPIHLYYNPAIPNGELWLWPVPTFNYGLELGLLTLFAQVALGDTVSLPPAYEEAITLSLAEACIASFPANGRNDLELKTQAKNARALIIAPNTTAPRMSLRDGGLGTSGGDAFNYYSGEVV